MSIPILVEPTATGFRAETGGPLNLSADGPSSEFAVSALHAKILAKLQNGATIIHLPVPPPSPVPEESMADNPLFDDWVAAVKEYRRMREAEEEALEAQRDGD